MTWFLYSIRCLRRHVTETHDIVYRVKSCLPPTLLGLFGSASHESWSPHSSASTPAGARPVPQISIAPSQIFVQMVPKTASGFSSGCKFDLLHTVCNYNVYLYSLKVTTGSHERNTEHFVLCGHVVFEIWEQTDRHTYMHADTLIWSQYIETLTSGSYSTTTLGLWERCRSLTVGVVAFPFYPPPTLTLRITTGGLGAKC